MKRLWSLIREYWEVIRRPSAYFSLGFLTLGGFIFGVIFWGGFNTALEVTNTEKFCISCHEMRENVYQELTRTVHFTNRSGVRATCPDCHVPHEWTHKIARKMQASKEVWGKIFGTINTRQKFLDHRLELAKHEWARLKANDSLECRNCHSTIAMDFTRQSRRAAEIHERYLVSGERTCIDCHKGIAHELPDMTGIEPGWQAPTDLRAAPKDQQTSADPLMRHTLSRFLANR
ncbi:cytochrome c3 family protein [Rhizobiales bacterium]|uniref:cytochrome c3 family protein n=1 Tax=Hongsoonwoonella zoysiae TaxID=2821844 RepID=UPI0015600442|nr:cytochrome c3 family protein [Hongsoonwoonella zoysiae]NRG18187.1 cytochrome c3 family protein [Hongsoonwoonella zoysiae]